MTAIKYMYDVPAHACEQLIGQEDTWVAATLHELATNKLPCSPHYAEHPVWVDPNTILYGRLPARL